VQQRCAKLAAEWEPDAGEDEPSAIPHRRR
jgi:hypothetical protein